MLKFANNITKTLTRQIFASYTYAKFNYVDPLNMQSMLTDEEKMVDRPPRPLNHILPLPALAANTALLYVDLFVSPASDSGRPSTRISFYRMNRMPIPAPHSTSAHFPPDSHSRRPTSKIVPGRCPVDILSCSLIQPLPPQQTALPRPSARLSLPSPSSLNSSLSTGNPLPATDLLCQLGLPQKTSLATWSDSDFFC